MPASYWRLQTVRLFAFTTSVTLWLFFVPCSLSFPFCSDLAMRSQICDGYVITGSYVVQFTCTTRLLLTSILESYSGLWAIV